MSAKPVAKAKAKKLSGPEVTAIVKEYVLKCNKPFNAVTIHLNLHMHHAGLGKKDCERAIAALVADGTVCEKPLGKTSHVYWPNQALLPEVTDAQLAELCAQLRASKETLLERAAADSAARAELATIEREPTDDVLDATLAELDGAVDAARRRVATLERLAASAAAAAAAATAASSTAGDATATAASTAADTQRALAATERGYKRRKRVSLSVLDTLSESMDKSVAVLVDEIGVEPDTPSATSSKTT